MSVRDSELFDEFLREALESARAQPLGDGGALESAGLLALLADAAEPSRALRERTVAALRTTHRFDDLEQTLAELVDLPLDRLRPLLVSIDSPTKDRGGAWEPGPAPGIHLLHFRGGPKVADAVTGFVRLPVDVQFPVHEHVGDEAVMVLQGAFRDSRGSIHRRGEVVRMPAGSHHSLIAIGPVPLCYAAVIHRGVKIGDETMTPDDPRA